MRKAIVAVILILFVLMVFSSTQTGSVVYYIEQINAKLIGTPTTTITQPSTTTTGTANIQEGSVLLPTSYISTSCIDTILKSAGSPAYGTGAKWTEMAQKYNINPAVGLAFFRQESSLGTKGVAVDNKSVGNIRDPSTGTFKKYASWNDSIEDWFSLIAGKKYIGAGKTTIRDIYIVYAPPSDNANWESLVTNLETFAKQYNTYAGKIC